MLLEERHDEFKIVGLERMINGGNRPARAQEPLGSRSVQRAHQAGRMPGKLRPQKIPEQTVIAVEPLLLVDHRDEQAVALEPRQQFRRIAAPAHRIAERRVELRQDAGLQQEIPDLLWLAGHHILGQIFGNGGGGAGESRHQVIRVGAPLERHGCQPQRGGPALRAAQQLLHLFRAQRQSAAFGQEGTGLGGGKSQLLRNDFEQLTMGAQLAQTDFREGTRSQHQPGVGRQPRGHLLDEGEHGRIANHVDLVEEQHEGRIALSELIRKQRRHVARVEGNRGIELIELPESDSCCGFGGLFAVKNPDTSAAMGLDKIANVQASGAEVLCASDNSCLTHLSTLAQKSGSLVPGFNTNSTPPAGAFEVKHIAEILASTKGVA